MNNRPVGTEAIALLSRVTGKDLNPKHITPSVLFITALSTLLVGSMCLDRVASDDKNRYLLRTLKQVVASEGNLHRFTQLILNGVKRYQIYRDIKALRILTVRFSPSEKLLLLIFGYRMSSIGGMINAKECSYLRKIGTHLKLQPQHLKVLEATFQSQPVRDRVAWAEVCELLDSSNFENKASVVKKAASLIEDKFPKVAEKSSEDLETTTEDEVDLRLTQFNNSKNKIGLQGYEFLRVLQDLCNRKVIATELLTTTRELLENLSDSRFRISVIGEFSKGKSTFVNALIGAKIQPVRAIPCTGTVSILRYGKQTRAVCHYNDGTTQTIPIEEYSKKVTISKSKSQNIEDLNHELANSSLKSIVLETPKLKFCRKDAEIIDSPGLNGHPERTKIIQQVAKNTDVIIFLMSAQNILRENECRLFNEIRNPFAIETQKGVQPASNIFMVVNFLDILLDDDDDEDSINAIKSRVEDFCFHEQPRRIQGANRVHYISARKAIQAKFNNENNSYRRDFENLTKALEEFLMAERGSLKLQRFSDGFNQLMTDALAAIQDYQNLQESSLENVDLTKTEVFERMAQAGACQVRVENLAKKLYAQVSALAAKSLEEWQTGLNEKMCVKSESWTSEYEWLRSRDELIEDYIQQFKHDLLEEIKIWVKQDLIKKVIKPGLDELDSFIAKEIESIKEKFEQHRSGQEDYEESWVFASTSQRKTDEESKSGLNVGMLGLGNSLISGLFLGSFISKIAGVIGSRMSGFSLKGMLDINTIIRESLIEEGITNFRTSQEDMTTEIKVYIAKAFTRRVNTFSEIITNTLSVYENDIERLVKLDTRPKEEHASEMEWLNQQRERLQGIQQEINQILSV
ncbi:MAG: Dynamin family [Phormidium sp. OSCR]|nr:MAG: Dynamin family [Phormidium sp. OSCR]